MQTAFYCFLAAFVTGCTTCLLIGYFMGAKTLLKPRRRRQGLSRRY